MEQTAAFSTGLAHLRAQLAGEEQTSEKELMGRDDGCGGGTHKSPSPANSRPSHLCFQFSQLAPTIVTQEALALLLRGAKEQERIMGWELRQEVNMKWVQMAPPISMSSAGSEQALLKAAS